MAQWAGDKGPGQFYCSTNYLIDIEHNVILDVEPTPSHRTAEVSSTRTMIAASVALALSCVHAIPVCGLLIRHGQAIKSNFMFESQTCACQGTCRGSDGDRGD